jgi:hypothetical protein
LLLSILIAGAPRRSARQAERVAKGLTRRYDVDDGDEAEDEAEAVIEKKPAVKRERKKSAKATEAAAGAIKTEAPSSVKVEAQKPEPPAEQEAATAKKPTAKAAAKKPAKKKAKKAAELSDEEEEDEEEGNIICVLHAACTSVTV